MKSKILLFFFFCTLTLSAKQIEVCSTCSVKTVKDAVEIAVSGDEIFIKKGVYKERDVIINKELSLIGENGTIIDGENIGNVFVFKTDNFTIKNVKIINIGMSYTVEYCAIKVIRAKNFTIEGCILDNVFFGILIEKSSKGIIRDNIISGNRKSEASSGNGIHIWDGNEMEVFNNQLTGLRDGIYFEFVKNSEVYKNVSHEF